MTIEFIKPKYKYKFLNITISPDDCICIGYYESQFERIIIVKQNNIFFTLFVLIHELLHYIFHKIIPPFYINEYINKYFLGGIFHGFIDKYMKLLIIREFITKEKLKNIEY